MSIWTHVIGSIRFDGLQGLMPKPDCGKTCSYDDPEEIWKACNIPCGSEGSLQISYWTNPDKNCLSAYTVTIFGDLRAYDNKQEIIDYFNRIVKDQMVRQAVFSIEVEGKPEEVFIYDDDFKTFIECSKVM